MKLLLIEDNPTMQATLQRSFERRGIQVATCSDGLRAVDRWQASVPDVVLLDLTLPGLDGLEVLTRARTGADDYLPKPFDLDELEARVRALARRGSGNADPRAEPADFHGLRVDNNSGAVYCRGQPMELAPREAALLRALLAHAGQAVAKERLFDQVFAGEADVQPDAIEVVAYRLRKKLTATGVKLVTLRGLGYLVAPE
jgi:two-component system response regulator TctD